MANSNKQEVLKILVAHHPSFVDFLKSDLDTAIQSLISLNDTEQLRRAQGRANYLQNLLDDIEKARRA